MADFTTSHQTFPYLEYSLLTKYEQDSGKLQLPVAYQTGTQVAKSCEIVEVSAPSMRKVVTFSIQRLGAKPELPDPTPSSSNETLLKEEISLSGPVLTPDGNQVFGATGRYIYALSSPINNLPINRTAVDASQSQTLTDQEYYRS